MRIDHIVRATLITVCLFVSQLQQRLFGQSFPGGSGIEVSVFVFSQRSPALSEHFVKQLEARTLLMVRSMLGSGAQVDLLRLPNLSGWLQENRLSDLTAEKCRDFDCDKTEKTILLCVRYAHGAFYLSGAEYDRHFDTFGPLQTSETVQRSMVADATGRMAMNCWTPIGKINSLKNAQFSIGFTNQARLMSVPNWSRLKKGAVLQLYRETIDGNQLRQDAHPTQFLMISSVDDVRGISAVPVGKPWDEGWFQYLDDPRARYLVRRVTPQKGTSTIQVFLSGKIPNQPDVLVPRGSCDVYVNDAPPSGTQMIGRAADVTNREGIATISVDSESPVFVTVLYEDKLLTQPFIRGVTPEPAVFQFTYAGNQSDYVTSLNWLRDKARANSAVINSLIKTINETARDGDAAMIGKMMDEALALSNVDDLLDKANSIEKLAKADNIDLSERVESFRNEASKLREQTAKLKQELSDAKMFAVSEHQLEEFQQLFNEMKWPEALAALEKFATDFPDHPQTEKLPGFRAAVEPKDSDHEKAREVLLSSIGMARSETLMQRWDVMRDALDVLIKHDDSLYLTNVSGELDSWITLLNKEITEIQSLNVPGLSVDDAQKLRTRANKALQVKSDFDRLRQPIKDIAIKSKKLLRSSAPDP